VAFDSEEIKGRDRTRKKAKYQTRRDTILKNRYGIMEFDYEQLAQQQNNKCAICGVSPENKRLDLDHCHTTKKIRGLLCNNCNRGLGHFKDNPQLLTKAIEYLKPKILQDTAVHVGYEDGMPYLRKYD
jgi:hypothetical protein